MKLMLKKKALKNLSKDVKVLPADVTPAIGGGITLAVGCNSQHESVCGATCSQTTC